MNKSIRFLLLMLLLPVYNMAAQEGEPPLMYEIGSFSITILPEGSGQGNTEILIGATPEMLNQCLPEGTYTSAMNAFLVETDEKTILVDAGLGRNLFANLEVCKKSPEKIDIILITHMHGDHIGGLLQNDNRSFPNATLYIPQPEYDYWMNDEIMQSLPENRRGSFTQARKVIEAYKSSLQLFVPGELDGATHEVFPGIRSIAAYGHTPGHTIYMLESGDSRIMIWGDLTHVTPIQMDYPQVAVTYDVDPVKAVESRQRILQYLADNKIDIAGMHVQYPGVGKVSKNKSGGYIFTLTCDCEGIVR